MKRLLLLLSLLVPFSVLAQFSYITNNGAIVITDYYGTASTVSIPETINGFPVVRIGSAAFYNKSSIRSITIPQTVTNISSSAFAYCTKLISVALSAGVVSVGESAFEHCSSLYSVSISSTVMSIGRLALSRCPSLGVITVDSQNQWFSSLNGVLFNKDQTKLIQYPTAVGGTYTVPDGVAEIGPVAFMNCGYLQGITFSDTVEDIGEDAFYGCTGLEGITLPGRLTNIRVSTFSACSGLKNVTLGNRVTILETSAFQGCSNLRNITLPDSVTTIGQWAFYLCGGLTNVIIGRGITNIVGGAFLSCTSLEGVYFRGNAPSSSQSFSDTGSARAYYLPGTLGWGARFGDPYGLPTTPWYLPIPQVLSFGQNFGVRTNAFGFVVSWATNLSIVVEACVDTANNLWQPVRTNALVSGSAYFSDSRWTNYPCCLYRVRSL